MRWATLIFVALFSVGDFSEQTDYIVEDNILYWILPDMLTHDAAEEKCATQGMTLISVQSGKEQFRIIKYMKWFGIKKVWTSGNDTKEIGCFTWNTRRNVHGVYTNWANNPTKLRPHEYSSSADSLYSSKLVEIANSNFIAIDSNSNYSWVIRPSDSLFSAICEIEMEHFDEVLKKFNNVDDAQADK